MLTIAQFADRTGISPSALRFYERKGLLIPLKRLENGYRVYSPEQVADAQLINSLRESGASVAGIREFLARDASSRQQMLGEVGFRVKPRAGRLPAGVRAEEVPPTLFATLECGVDDEKAAHRIFRFLHEFGFAPAGLHLERYLPWVTDRYQIMIGIGQQG